MVHEARFVGNGACVDRVIQWYEHESYVRFVAVRRDRDVYDVVRK
jgi:hypothetical protein